MDNYEGNNPSRKDSGELNPEPGNESSSEQIIRNDDRIDTQEEVITENHTQEQKGYTEQRNGKKEKSNWKGGVFGGLIGGIIAAIIVAALFSYNIIPTNNNATESDPNSPAADDSSNIVETLATEDAIPATNINEAANAVVGVVNLQQQNVWAGSQEAGTGSGIIYKKENGKAYVVTNQHVVDGAQEVEIVLNNEERISATVLGEDSLTDLAVLEVDGEQIDTVANLGSSGDMQVGETVLAIGNPLGMEFANSVTKGIVSGLNRSVSVDTNSDGQADWVTEVIQTDAAINPGNSGGALVNEDGQVIGINSMKVAQGAVEGIGFAIPVDTALPIIEQLETDGEISRPLIGISTASLNQVPPQYRYEINLPDDVKGGMVIANIQSGSPAEEAGLQQFDVITKIKGQEVTSILELRKYLYSDTKIGDTIEVEYIRDGERQTTNLELKEMNEQENAA